MCRDTELLPVRELKPGRSNRNVQKPTWSFFDSKGILHTCSIHYYVTVQEICCAVLPITFSKIFNYKTGWPDLCPLVGGWPISLLIYKNNAHTHNLQP